MKQETDDLLADSVQIRNLITQEHQQGIFLKQDFDNQLRDYLVRYQRTKPSLKFMIFLYSGVYPGLISRYFEGGHYAYV